MEGIKGTIEFRDESFQGRDGNTVEYQAMYLVTGPGKDERFRLKMRDLSIPEGATVTVREVGFLNNRRIEIVGVSVAEDPRPSD